MIQRDLVFLGPGDTMRDGAVCLLVPALVLAKSDNTMCTPPAILLVPGGGLEPPRSCDLRITSSTATCTASGSVVTYVSAGTCTLTAQAVAGAKVVAFANDPKGSCVELDDSYFDDLGIGIVWSEPVSAVHFEVEIKN